MRIKMTSLMAGPRGIFHPDQVIDVSQAEAVALVSGGFAEYVDRPTPTRPETATAEPPERAVLPSAARRPASEPVEATDAAAELAAELGIDLADVEGTGSGGRVTKADVERRLYGTDVED